VGADELHPNIRARLMLADKALDSDEQVIEPILAAGKKVVIPSTRLIPTLDYSSIRFERLKSNYSQAAT
jgi:hypothetical protein